MGHHLRYKRAGIQITRKKLEALILEFLDKHEADMTADYDPSSEVWKRLLAENLSVYILKGSK
jgi:hypothetical protein